MRPGMLGSQEKSYTVTATGNSGNTGAWDYSESHFVDELLALSMSRYSRR